MPGRSASAGLYLPVRAGGAARFGSLPRVLDMELDFDPSELQPHDFEKNFNNQKAREWMRNNWHMSLYFAAAYLVLIFGIQHLMKEQRAYNLRPALTLWSLSLALFSAAGAIRVWKVMAFIISTKGFKHSVCSQSFLVQPIFQFWGYLFVLSKLLELGDTVFIVLQKKKLIFLHWYHHTTTLIVSWYACDDLVVGGGWSAAVNYSVHAIMYSYYALRAAGFQVSRFIAMTITTIQMVQIVGYIIMNVLIIIWMEDNVCPTRWTVIFISSVLYVSYLVLFGNYFFQTYLRRSQKSKRE
ncbi:very long chain fatty acid elongase 3 [Athene noctua]|uniref:very long chain fatty acid elongase 3 n=1 Tax=Athene noctua TaxID=126797 RepID=UPI003EB86D23